MADLQEMLFGCNPHVNIYRQAAERLRAQGQNATEIQARPTYRATLITGGMRYNILTADEIMVVLPGEGVTDAMRHIILHLRVDHSRGYCHDLFILVDNHSTFAYYFPSLCSLGSQDGYLGIRINLQVYLPLLPAISISHPHHHHCFTITTVRDPYNPPRTSL